MHGILSRVISPNFTTSEGQPCETSFFKPLESYLPTK